MSKQDKGLLLTDEKTREIARKWFPPKLIEVAHDYGYHIQGALLAKAQPIIEKQAKQEGARERLQECLNDLVRADGAENLKLLEKRITELIYEWRQALKGGAE